MLALAQFDTFINPDNMPLFSALSGCLQSVPPESWGKVVQQPGPVTRAAFGVVLVHGILQARQMYGCRGLSQRLPLSEVQLVQGLDLLSNQVVTGGEDFNLDNVSRVLYEVKSFCLVSKIMAMTIKELQTFWTFETVVVLICNK